MYPPSSRPVPTADPTPTNGSVHGPHPTEDNRPPKMDHDEKMRIRAAAFRAKKIYPGPVGELISRELLLWEEFGFRFGGTREVQALVQHVMTAVEPEPGHPG